METPLERRLFLALGASALLPGRLRAQDSNRPGHEFGSRRKPLMDAWKHAGRKGRALLVIVAPKGHPARGEAQELWKEALTNGHDELFADLALTEVAVGSRLDIERQLGKALKLPKDNYPLAFLMETDTKAVTHIDAKKPELGFYPVSIPEAEEQARRAQVTRYVQNVQAALRSAVAKDAKMLEARRVLEEEAIGKPDRSRVEISPALAPAQARVWAEAAGEGRKFAIHAIAEASRKHLRLGAPPPGPPRPGPIGGCGGVPCGTGHIPAASRRFLYFLTQS